jgi:ligand-binding SRPBCC domain-containing protein
VPASVRLFEQSQRVEVPIARAFDFYGDAGNLEPLAPPWLHFEVTSPPVALQAGTLLDYRLRLHGVPLRWQTQIVTWEPPERFVDIQAKGPFDLWEHTHLFEEDGDATTVIRDHVRYAIPFGPLGAIAERLFVRRDLKRIFAYRNQAVSERLVAE